jgi:Na+/proline symporter
MRAVIVGERQNLTYVPLTRTISGMLPTMGKDFDSYFLANRAMASSRTSSLLVSTSFGANSILYATWLGYVMGFWALLIHAAWCLSFVLLAKFATKIYQHTSLHDFLGCRFGYVTRIIASLCSIIGLLYFAGWEIAIAKSGVESLFLGAGMDINSGLPFIVVITTLIAILYTTVGGKKANGYVDFVLNIAKFVLLGVVVLALGKGIMLSANSTDTVLLPSIFSAIGSIGVVGFITNMLFNVSWQFVDNSSWQSVISGNQKEDNVAKKSLISASKGIFISYILGTALGVFLRGVPNLNSDNILGGIASSGVVSIGIVISLIVLLLISMVSLIDGIGLSVAQSFLVDLNLGKKFKKLNGFAIARVLTVVAGIFAAWGIQLILGFFGKSTFDFVYIFIVAQLSLLGTVLVGLLSMSTNSKYIWISILVGITGGFSASILGGLFELEALSEAAGTISAVSSVLVALLCTFIRYIRTSTGCRT